MKINYQQILDDLILDITKSNKVPTLLLHSCCAPCSSYVLEYLSNYFVITILYYNPNILDKKEYNRRVIEQKKLISLLDTKYKINYIDGDYEPDLFIELTKGLEHELEGGKRCNICYKIRLEKTAAIANKLNFDYFTTTLSVSPYKNSQKLNNIGEELSPIYRVKYLSSDFKKKNGYKRSIELSKQYGLYRQDYCGCPYSKRDHLKVKENV